MARRALGFVLAIVLVAIVLAAFSIVFILYQPTRDGTAAAGATPSASVGHGSEVVALPIRQFNVVTAESAPPQLTLEVTGYVPDSCTKPRQPVVKRNGRTIVVTIEADRETGVMCAQVATPYRKRIALGSAQPGSYTLIVNGTTRTVQVH